MYILYYLKDVLVIFIFNKYISEIIIMFEFIFATLQKAKCRVRIAKINNLNIRNGFSN